MRTQAEKGRLFWERQQRREILILPNPWDAGTAKLLASVGFEALATTSLGMSNVLGRVDGEGSGSRAELLENCRIISEATRLPVNVDLENGYADDPHEAATILRDAAEMGVVGGSIEDWSGERIYDFIPSPADQDRCAQLRRPIDMIVHGWSTRRFQAKQQ